MKLKFFAYAMLAFFSSLRSAEVLDADRKVDLEVTGFYLSIVPSAGYYALCSLDDVKHYCQTYQLSFDKFLNLNQSFKNEDYFIYIQVNDWKTKEQQENVAPAAANNQDSFEATKDLQTYGGFLNKDNKLAKKEFPCFLPLSLFVNEQTKQFMKEDDIVSITLDNLVLTNNQKAKVKFNFTLKQNNRFSDKKFGKTIYVALNELHKRYFNNLTKSLPKHYIDDIQELIAEYTAIV